MTKLTTGKKVTKIEIEDYKQRIVTIEMELAELGEDNISSAL